MQVSPQVLESFRALVDADGVVSWQLSANDQLQPIGIAWNPGDSDPAQQLGTPEHQSKLQRFHASGKRFAADVEKGGTPTARVLARDPETSPELLLELLWLNSAEPRCSPERTRGAVSALLLTLQRSSSDTHDKETAADGAVAELLQFCQTIHRSIDLEEACLLAANEARAPGAADRVVVGILRGARLRLMAASGTEKLVQRARETRMLTRLCATVAETGQAAEWSTAQPEVNDVLQDALADCVQITHLRAVSLMPLFHEPRINRDDDPRYAQYRDESPRLLGVVAFEQYRSAEIPDDVRSTRQAMAEHMGTALGNARLHSSLPLRRPLLAAGRLFNWFRGRRLAIASLAATLAVVFGLCCVFVPWEYKVSCDGILVTQSRADVFAPEAGLVSGVLVGHNDAVQSGQPLLQLRNDELQARQAVADSRVTELQKLVRSYALQINEADRQGEREASIRLQGDLKRTEIELHGAEQSLRLVNDQIASLTVRAPSDGRVATFQLEQEVLNRPVTRGDRLLQVYPPQGPWVLEVSVPEYRSGYVRRAMQQDSPPRVEFILATHVELTRYAELLDVSTIVEHSEDDGSILTVRAPLQSAETLPALNYGAECHVRIHCGKYSLGWCLFGDVVEFLQRHFWI